MDIKSGCVFDEKVHGLKMLTASRATRRTACGIHRRPHDIRLGNRHTAGRNGRFLHHLHEDRRGGRARREPAGAARIAQALHTWRGPSGDVPDCASLILMPKIDAVRVADPLDAGNARRFAASCRERLAESFGIGRLGSRLRSRRRFSRGARRKRHSDNGDARAPRR